jgi:phage-related tail fiber protein
MHTAAGDPKAARQLLRTGAFNGLRDNVRALGEYAITAAAVDADKETAAGLVPATFKALEDLDNTLFIAQRDKQEVDVQEASQKVEAAAAALAALLATVPADTRAAAQLIVDKVNAKAAATGSSGADGASEDAEALKQLLTS